MPQYFHRAELEDITFPLLSEQQGRTVIGSTSAEIYDKHNKPNVYYAHNMMPTSYSVRVSVIFLRNKLYHLFQLEF